MPIETLILLWQAARRGGTVRDSHPLPFSLAFYSEHLGLMKQSIKVESEEWCSGKIKRLMSCHLCALEQRT